MKDKFPKKFPKQHQKIHPGIEEDMNPKPIFELNTYDTKDKLQDKVAIITGGDSGIGRAVSLAYIKQKAKVVIVYLNEDEDAKKTQNIIKENNGECLVLKGDIRNEEFCKEVISNTIDKFKKIDILINNAAVQYECENIEDITSEQLENTFRTNIFGAFYLVKAAMPYLKEGSCIINTTSVTAFKGSKTLIDYSSSKGALATFTRSLAINLAEKGIRVNAVAPGPIWTPLIPSSFKEDKVENFGSDTPMQRAGQPVEVAGAYVFLASDDASYITGETIHINGGNMINA